MAPKKRAAAAAAGAASGAVVGGRRRMPLPKDPITPTTLCVKLFGTDVCKAAGVVQPPPAASESPSPQQPPAPRSPPPPRYDVEEDLRYEIDRDFLSSPSDEIARTESQKWLRGFLNASNFPRVPLGAVRDSWNGYAMSVIKLLEFNRENKGVIYDTITTAYDWLFPPSSLAADGADFTAAVTKYFETLLTNLRRNYEHRKAMIRGLHGTFASSAWADSIKDEGDAMLRISEGLRGQKGPPCPSCRSTATIIFNQQTKSGDEGMAAAANCLNCGRSFKR